MTIKQQHYFFELVEKLGYNKDELITNAKNKYNKEHFTELTTEEISPLIEILEKELQSTLVQTRKEHPLEDFPNEYRIWDKETKTWRNNQDVLAVIEFDKSYTKERFHVMQYTGRKDETEEKIFDFDFIESFVGRKYLVQWSWKECAWLAYDEVSDQSMYLSSMGKIKKIGDIYHV